MLILRICLWVMVVQNCQIPFKNNLLCTNMYVNGTRPRAYVANFKHSQYKWKQFYFIFKLIINDG